MKSVEIEIAQPSRLPRWTVLVSGISHRALVAALIGLMAGFPVRAQQLPTGGTVTTGSAAIVSPNANTLNINQSTNQAIINWQSFSIGKNATVNFNQPNASSSTLNRVIGTDASMIRGVMNAPGTVLLVNPNGITISKSGVINVGSFAASTLNIKDSDYLAGNYKFTGNGGSAGVINRGTINVSDGGFAALLGGQVSNSGTVSARLGKVGLGAGELITLDFAGDGFLSVAVPSSQLGNLVNANGALVKNSGKIRADGGTVMLSAATAANVLRDAVNVPGSIRANSVGTQNGKIVIGGGVGGKVNVTGKLAARGGKKNAGGTVEVAGAEVNLAGTVNVSGKTGGKVTAKADQKLTVSGSTLAKGTEQGGKVDLSGKDIYIAGGLIDASALGSTGVAGEIKIVASGTTDVSGTIKADGGGAVTLQAGDGINVNGTIGTISQTGIGGTVNVSAPTLTIAGTINASGAAGGIITATGTLSLHVTGTLASQGLVTTGGTINVTAKEVKLEGATLDVSGVTGGGKIQIGGGYQGTGSLAHALKVVIDPNTAIRADALGKGDGGTVIVWSDKSTSFAGSIGAKGGAQGGNGGFAEVSGKETLSYNGFTDLRAANGRTGTLLLDPYNITISNAANSGVTGFVPNANDSNINVTTLQTALTGANVVISTGGAGSPGSQAGNITVVDAVTWASGNSLTLNAANNVVINAAITATNGTLNLNAGLVTSTGTITQSASGVISVNTLNLSTQGGNAALGTAFNSVTNLGTTSLGAGSLDLKNFGGLTVAGAVSASGGIQLIAGGSIAINNALNAGGGSVTLIASGAGNTITQNASGAITANLLSVFADADVNLGAATNAITFLGLVTLTNNGSFSLLDAGGLTTLLAVSTGTGSVSLTTSGQLDINSTIDAGAVSLRSTLNLAQIRQNSSGLITTGALSLQTVNGAVALAGSTHAVTGLGTVSLGFGLFELKTASATGLTLAGGAITANGGIFVTNTTGGITTSGALASDSVISLTTTLAGTGITTQAGATLSGSQVTLSSAGGIDTTGGNVSAMAGPVSMTAATDITTGNLSASLGGVLLTAANNITTNGTVSGQFGVVMTATNGNISTGGAVSSSSAGVTLSAANGGITLGDNVSGGNGGNVSLTSRDAFVINHIISSNSGGVVAINVTGAGNGISQIAAGGIQGVGADLQASGTVNVTAGAANNNVIIISGRSGGDFAFTEGGNSGLTVGNAGSSGIVSTGGNVSLQTWGDLTIANNGFITVDSAHAINLTSTDNQVVQGTGVLTGGKLGVSAGTNINLQGTNNIQTFAASAGGYIVLFNDGGFALDTVGSINNVTAGSDVVLATITNTAGNITQTTNGRILAGGGLLLQAQNGSIVLDQANTVSGSFAVTGTQNGDVTLRNTGTLNVGTAGAAAGLTFDGITIATNRTLSLTSVSGQITQSKAITAGTVSGLTFGQNMTLLDAGNNIFNLGTTSLGAGQLSLFSGANSLTVSGIVSATGGVSLQTPSALTVSAAIDAGSGSVSLTQTTATNGFITQSGAGVITAGSLAVIAAGQVVLGASNNVGEISGNSSNGQFAFFNNHGAGNTLTVQGIVSTGGRVWIQESSGNITVASGVNSNGQNIVLQAGGALAVNAAVTATGADIGLQGVSGISQNAAGIITAADLLAVSNNGTITLTQNNVVGGNVGFTANNGSVSFKSTSGFNVGGISTVEALSISPGIRTAAAGSTTLNAGGAITQSGGATDIVSTGTLNLTTSGNANATLGNASNAITNLGTVSIGTGALTLVDTGGLTVTGAVNALSVRATTTGTITIDNIITATGSGSPFIWLTASGAGSNITQTANGGFVSPRLELDATGGSVSATAGAANNNITFLGGRSDGDFAYADGNSSTVVITTVVGATPGIVSTNGSISVSATKTNAQMQVSRDVTASNGNVTLLADKDLFIGSGVSGAGNGKVTANSATGVITLTGNTGQVRELAGGSLTGAKLAVSAGTDIDFRNTNTIGRFAANAGGYVLLINNGSLVIDQVGTVSGITAFSDVVLFVDGSITQTANGKITAGGGLALEAFLSSITLDQANSVAGNFALIDNTATNVTLRNTGNLNIGTISPSFVAGSYSGAQVSGTLSLNSDTGSITQSARIIATTIQGSTGANGSMTLTHADNEFGAVGLTSLGGGALSVFDKTGGLTVSGAVTAGGGISLQTPGALAINAMMDAGSGNVSLTNTTSGAGITQSAAILGNTLTVASAGDVDLKTNTNSVAAIEGGTSNGHFYLYNNHFVGLTVTSNGIANTGGPVVVWEQTGNLTVNGAVNSNGANVGLWSSNGILAINAPVTAANATVALWGGAGISQAATGVVTSSNLLALSTGAGANIALTADNVIGGNIGIQAAGSASFTSTSGFNVGGVSAVNFPGVGIFSIQEGINTAAAGSTTLTAGGNVTQSFGQMLNTGTLNLSSAADANFTFNSAIVANKVTNLGTVSIGNGALVLNDIGGLTVTGAVNAGGGVTLTTSGGLTFNAAVNAGTNTISLNAGGTIDQDANGVLTAATLNVNSNNNAVLLNTAANAITDIGTADAGSSTFRLRSDVATLTVAGSITAGAGVILRNNTGSMQIDGAIATDAGTGDVDLRTNGSIGQSAAGVITANTLFVSNMGGGGNLLLDGATNQINILNGVTGGSGQFALLDAGGLTVSSNVNATGGISINTSGLLAINNVLNAGATGNVSLTNTGPGAVITQNASGSITGNTLAIASAGNVDLRAAANSVASVEGGSSNGYFFFFNTRAGGLTIGSSGITNTGGSVYIRELAGNLTVSGAVDSNGANLGLTAQGVLTINAAVTATGASVALMGLAGIAQGAAGIITANNLVALSTGVGADIALTADNVVGGNVSIETANGSVSFTSTSGFVIGGINTVNLGPAASFGILFPGIRTAAGGSTTLIAGGNVTQDATDIISTGTLNLTSAGTNFTLDNANNAVTNLGAVALGTGALILKNSVNLTLTGAVSAGGGVTIDNTGFITSAVGGTITTNGAEIALTAGTDVTIGDTVTSNGGVIAFQAGATKTLTINAAVNAGAGDIFLTADNMTIAAPVFNTGSVNIATVTGNRAITLGNAPAPTGLVLDAGELNSFIGMSSFNAGKTRAGVTNAGDIQFGQSLFATDAVNLFTNAGVKQNNPIVFIGATGAGTLTITAGNTVDLRPGVAAGLIQGTASGPDAHFIAYGGGSHINIGPITTGGGEIVAGNNNGTLTVVGDLKSNGGNINATSIGLLTLSADLDARKSGGPDGSISVVSVAGINQTAGGLKGKDLVAFLCNLCFGSTTGNITLDSTANAITGNVTLVNLTGGNINFTNDPGYTVGGISSITYNSIGAIDVSPYTGLAAGSAGIRTAGTSATVTLTAGGDIGQATGANDIVETNTLVVNRITNRDVNVTFDNFSGGSNVNKVANLGNVSVGQGNFTLYNNSDLTITGTSNVGGTYDVMSDGNVTLAAGALINTSSVGGDVYLTSGCGCVGGTLTLNGNINAGTGTVYLAAETVTQALSGAAILANTLNVQAESATLDSQSNAFSVINAQITNNFSATSGVSLTVGNVGVVSFNGNVSLTTVGATSDITVPGGFGGGIGGFDITLNAGRDVVVNGAVFGNGTVSATAARDISVSSCGCGGLFGNDVTLDAGRDITVDAGIAANQTASFLAGRNITDTSNAQIQAISLRAVAGNGIGSTGAVDLSHGNNSVGTIAGSAGGNFSYVQDGDLTIGTVTSGVVTQSGIASSTGGITVNAGTGNITIDALARVVAGSLTTSEIILAGNSFINNRGSDAVANTNGRWLIYANAPGTAADYNGLNSGNTAIWGTTYPTPVAASGNRYVFQTVPTVTLSPTDVAKVYGQTPVLTYSATGLQPGVAGAYLADTIATATTGTPVLTSAGSAATASVAGGPYVITIALGSLAGRNGYIVNVGGTANLTVTPATLTYVADAVSRNAGTPNPAFTGTVTGFVNNETLATATTGALAWTSPADGSSPVGSYAINGSGLGAANYVFVQAAGNATALTVTPAPNNNATSQVTPPSNNPQNPGVNITYQNNPAGLANISFTTGAAPRTASAPTDVNTAGNPDAANRTTNNGFNYRPISVFDANQYSPIQVPDYADKASLATVFTMISRAAQPNNAADFMIDGFWTGTDATWAKGSDGKPVANRVTFSDGADKTVSPTETNTNGFPVEAGKTDLLAMLGKGPVVLGGSGTPATWLLAVKASDDGKGIIANDPISGRQVLLSYDAGTKTVGGVAGIFDAKTQTFVALSEAAATQQAGEPVLKADSLAPLNNFMPATFFAVTVK